MVTLGKVLESPQNGESLSVPLLAVKLNDSPEAVRAAPEILESRVPYLSLIYEISGDEIIAEVYVGSEPHPVWRMESDGSNLRQIGQIPAESKLEKRKIGVYMLCSLLHGTQAF